MTKSQNKKEMASDEIENYNESNTLINMSFIDSDSNFNYKKAKRTIGSFSLDTFHLQNEIPSVRRYPHISTFKDEFISTSKVIAETETSLDDLLASKSISNTLMNNLTQEAMMFINSKAIINVFKGYYHLAEYHSSTRFNYPSLFDSYLETIFCVFGSLKKRKMQDLIEEICNSSGMVKFYNELYSIWEEEGCFAEKGVLFGELE